MAPQWTKAQNDAITARGGSLLVSAAAGSGKTAVLAERAISLICGEESPIDADRLLIVTFSNAAAAEMKHRISARLREMLRENPYSPHLLKQQALMVGAQISTIHSFCIELLRSNFQILGISPDFVIAADENELLVMKDAAVAACIEKAYENDDSGEYLALLEMLATGSGDKALGETILKIYDFSRSHPFPVDWLNEKLELYDFKADANKTVWGESLLRYAVESLKFCRKSALEAIAALALDDGAEKAYGEALRSDLSSIEECLSAATEGDWDSLVKALSDYTPKRLGALKGNDGLKAYLKDARQDIKDTLKELSEKYINATKDEFKHDIAEIKPKIALLFSLVNDFAEKFREEKAKKNRFDFSDLEHLALALLVKKTPEGYVRTDKAGEISARFECVMVDEYQDTNEVQDLIFTSVSKHQENLFMVGDVKQSVYSFRQAMPEIFLKKRKEHFPYDTGFFPAKINLDVNFRSRREVTSAVNFLFSLLMSEDVGDVCYNDDESLKCGAAYPEYEGARPQVLLTLTGDYDGEKDATTLEAEAVAREISKMINGGYMVFDKDSGGMRPAEPRDFCILLRAPKNRAEVYALELSNYGVAAFCDGLAGYFVSREVSSAISMLKAVDNPLLDIELVAAMLSPFFDFTDDDIAKIRLGSRNTPFYTALVSAADTDARAAGFLEIFRELRLKSAVLPADKLIMAFYDMTSALSIARAMPGGDQRAANLRLFAQYASDYHELGYKQLGGFIGFITKLIEKKQDLAPAAISDNSANTVKIMSVHRSKGLEFPVVFLADTAKGFNKTDLRAMSALHSKYGFACVGRDRKSFAQFPTVPMQSIRLETERMMLSEEMRILYVALTRAREKLIISAVANPALIKRLGNFKSGLLNGKLPPYAVGKMNSYAAWVLSALLRHESAAELRGLVGISGLETINDKNSWDISINKPEAASAKATDACTEAAAKPDGDMLRELKRRTEFVYPFAEYTKIPAKLAISDIAKEERDLIRRFSERPKFMTQQALTPTEKGSAMHKFMQFASYENARENLAAEIEAMKIRRFLSPVEVESLDKTRLGAFFKSELAERIFKSPSVLRELKFMSEKGREVFDKMYPDMPKNAKIALQGVADCVFFEDGGAVIVDYKTDYIEKADELAERYRRQLMLYSLILGESLSVPVKECLLYSFHLSKVLKI